MSGSHGRDNRKRWRVESHPSNTWFTPAELTSRFREIMGSIELDPCTVAENPVGAQRFYTAKDDGILMPWDARTVFCNPPFGPTLVHWVEKCKVAAASGAQVILLVSTRPENAYYQAALEAADSVLMIRGRLAFQGMDRHTAIPCTVFGFNVSLASLSDWGVVLSREAA